MTERPELGPFIEAFIGAIPAHDMVNVSGDIGTMADVLAAAQAGLISVKVGLTDRGREIKAVQGDTP